MFEWLRHRSKPTKKYRTTEIDEEHIMPIKGRLLANLDIIREYIGNSSDVVIRLLRPKDNEVMAAVVYIDGLADGQMIQNNIIRPVLQNFPPKKENLNASELLEKVKDSVLTIRDLKEVDTLNECLKEALSGNTVLLLDNCRRALILVTPGWKVRIPEEPISEPTVRGPRDGFSENLQDNLVTLRRRIKDPNLTIIKMELGRRSKTDTAIIFIKDIADPKIVDEVRDRLSRIDADSIIAAGHVEQYIEDDFLSLFPQIQYTERPDKVAANLMEGRVAILVDNTPFASIVPVTFSMFLQATEDNYDRWIYTSLIRSIRYIAVLLSLFLPAFYVALISYHFGMIPTKLAIFIAAAREGIPFPALIEAFLMEITLEILREASLRLPKSIGQAVGIVGGLVIGEAATRAGIVSPEMVIIVSLTAISSFSVPQYALGVSMRILRFAIMLAAGVLGLYGVMLSFIMITSHLVKLKSFGVDYMSPIAPMQPKDWKDYIIKAPANMLKNRPASINTLNTKRENQRKGRG